MDLDLLSATNKSSTFLFLSAIHKAYLTVMQSGTHTNDPEGTIIQAWFCTFRAKPHKTHPTKTVADADKYTIYYQGNYLVIQGVDNEMGLIHTEEVKDIKIQHFRKPAAIHVYVAHSHIKEQDSIRNAVGIVVLGVRSKPILVSIPNLDVQSEDATETEYAAAIKALQLLADKFRDKLCYEVKFFMRSMEIIEYLKWNRKMSQTRPRIATKQSELNTAMKHIKNSAPPQTRFKMVKSKQFHSWMGEAEHLAEEANNGKQIDLAFDHRHWDMNGLQGIRAMLFN